MSSNFVRCPKCLGDNPLYTPYYKCYYDQCQYIDKEDISYQINEVEKEQRKEVEKIIKHLFKLRSKEVPKIEYPENSINPKTGHLCWGWADNKANTIFIPRKSFYLPNDELADTTAHEASHLISNEKEHEKLAWCLIYLRLRGEVFKEFFVFIGSTNPNAKFTKGRKIFSCNYVSWMWKDDR